MAPRAITKPNQATAFPNGIVGVVSAVELYSVAEAKRRMGFGTTAWNQLREHGLPLLKCGHKYFVLGKHIMNVVEQMAAGASKAAESEPRQPEKSRTRLVQRGQSAEKPQGNERAPRRIAGRKKRTDN
ncbi:MAG TPA: hypothetical protein VGG64_17390 [Pirellulales bacterium]|jgi:hypothetical protein